MAALNWFAIAAAAMSAFVLGGLWYGPLFKNAWCREAGMDPDAPQKRHPARVFAIAIVPRFARRVPASRGTSAPRRKHTRRCTPA
jgi:hypothetical protein